MYVETSIVLLISELEDGVNMYDAHFDSEIFVKSSILCVLADNPGASEFEHHLGSCANKFCRKCNVKAVFQLRVLHTYVQARKSLNQDQYYI